MKTTLKTLLLALACMLPTGAYAGHHGQAQEAQKTNHMQMHYQQCPQQNTKNCPMAEQMGQMQGGMGEMMGMMEQMQNHMKNMMGMADNPEMKDQMQEMQGNMMQMHEHMQQMQQHMENMKGMMHDKNAKP